MVKKGKIDIWASIKYYKIIPYLVALYLLYLSRNITLTIVTSIQDIRPDTFFYNIYKLLVYYGLPIVEGLVFFKFTRDRRYKVVTDGRNYGKDTSHFNRTYSELVEFYKESEPHKMDTSVYEVTNWRNCKGINFGYDKDGRAIWLPEDCEYNFAIFGPPGSSKTAGFCNVNAVTFPGSCLIVDIKSDIYNYVRKQKLRKKILRFCPDEKNALEISAHFDPLLGFNRMTPRDRKLAIERIANSLIPDDGGNENNYFPETARAYFRGVTHLLYDANPSVTFPQIVHSILQGNYMEWVNKAIAGDCIEAKELLAPFYGNSEKNVSGGYQNLTKRLNVFSDPILDELLTYKKGRTISSHALDQGYDIYLQISEKSLKTSMGSLLTMIIETFSDQFLDRPDTSTGAQNRKILMMLDELSSLHLSYDLLNVNLSKLRSKSVLTAIILQNLPQLRRLYGEDGSESILGNCHVQAILGANDNKTSRYFSEKLGMKKELRRGNSTNSNGKEQTISKTTQEIDVPVYRPEDVSDIKAAGENILYVDGKYTFLKKLNCYKDDPKAA